MLASLPTGYQNRFQVTTQQVSGSANQYQAIVTQTSPFNRSQVSELELFIEAREILTNRYSNRATIKMTIAAVNNDSDGNSCDINRNSPKFPVPMYIVNIREGNYTKVHQLLLEVSATDGDENQVSGILFDIQGVSNNGAGKFSLKSNGQTGKISIKYFRSCWGQSCIPWKESLKAQEYWHRFWKLELEKICTVKGLYVKKKSVQW